MRTDEPLQSYPLQYTETEIRSYLPSGWNLAGNPSGDWDPKKKVWKVTVLDNVDFDYPVKVSGDEMSKHGRLEALRLAIDKVFRERLG
jgi:hypothetical protein